MQIAINMVPEIKDANDKLRWSLYMSEK